MTKRVKQYTLQDSASFPFTSKQTVPIGWIDFSIIALIIIN